MKTFFFGDHIIFRTKQRHFLRLFRTSRNQNSVIFELALGPRSALGAPEWSSLVVMNIINFFHAVSDIIFQYSFFHAVSDITFQYFFFHAVSDIIFNIIQCYCSIILMFLGIIVQVLWCSYVFTVTYLLLLFFSHLSFCSCKGSTASCSEEASRFGKRNVKPVVRSGYE